MYKPLKHIMDDIHWLVIKSDDRTIGGCKNEPFTHIEFYFLRLLGSALKFALVYFPAAVGVDHLVPSLPSLMV